MKNHVAISAALLVAIGLATLLFLTQCDRKPNQTGVQSSDERPPTAPEPEPSPPTPGLQVSSTAQSEPAGRPTVDVKRGTEAKPAAEEPTEPRTLMASELRGTIIVASALEERELGAYLAAFRQQYPGIKVHVHRKSTADLIRLVREQRDDPTFDVVWGVALTKILGLQADGLLQPMRLDGLDRLTELYVDPAHRAGAESVHWVGMKALTTALCVRADSDYVARSPEDLARRIHRAPGRAIIMPAPTKSGTGLVFVVSIIQSRGWEAGWALLDAIDRNVAYYTSSGSAPCEAVAAQGKNRDMVGVSLGSTAVDTARKTQGADGAVKAVFFEADIPWEIEASALVAKPEIQPAALAFLQWSIGEDAMAAYNTITPGIAWKTPLPRPAPGFLHDLKQRLMPKTTEQFYQASGDEARILAEWSRRYGSRVR